MSADVPSMSGELPPQVDVSTPNPARIYDYLLGGANNFAVDRETAEQSMAAGSVSAAPARLNRSFLRRAVQFMVDQGIDQFLDLGSGIPTVGNVHEIAQHANPDARVVYVDNEPVAIAYARQLLADNPGAAIVGHDLRDVDAVLGSPEVAGLLDFSRPVGVLMVAIFHFIQDTDGPEEIISRYLSMVPSGSYLAMSHYTEDGHSEEKRARTRSGLAAYKRTQTSVVPRSRERLGELLHGLDILEPGIVWTPEWRPDGDLETQDPTEAEILAVVARIDH
ncbi:MAG TPA: SAM-dependent methyltransferase [Pseudonocardiaceae bacterium]|jgi:hypothetical protein|nr:SAM-dependent methyltransferase [Pseudonocardiaceae bacterium]